MSVRAKFRCVSVSLSADGSKILFTPVTGGGAENESFFKYTPGGSIALDIVNPETAKQFESGKTYYIDFTEAE